MSPLEAFIRSLSTVLPPGAKLSFTVELPGAAAAEVAGAEMPSAQPQPAPTPTAASAAAASAAPSADPAPASPGASRRASPRELLAGVRATHGREAEFKAKQWAVIVGRSKREIGRAVRARALPGRPKDGGRDHKATVVTIADMEHYLGTVDAVHRALIEPPAWWSDVRPARVA